MGLVSTTLRWGYGYVSRVVVEAELLWAVVVDRGNVVGMIRLMWVGICGKGQYNVVCEVL